MGSGGPRKVTTIRIFAAGTLLAFVIAIPAIAVTLTMHYILKQNLILTAVGGIITLFIAMAFGYKLSRKLAKVQDGDKDLEKA